ncbi:hypothetical protein WUBG_08550 [Wuchereria bancrofti]|uniref:Uncharacterized protein n=1 Tax=Wuchereria bancrofti TaxID=6293 RepID=J9EDL5_WUCBA|nr:hypothetical protein WUBG_08550 [Wuchereria bancrofti]
MLRVKCQSTSNFALTEGEIFLYDGRELVSNLDDIRNCMVQKGKCVTNTSIVSWNNTDATNHCLYRKIGRFDATRYGNHFVIDELQALLITKKTTQLPIPT